jgi:hypothetical protein
VDLAPPRPGEVIRYAYLWLDEARLGRSDGVRDRPCAVVMAVERRKGRVVVAVSPITRAQPAQGSAAIELPRDVKLRLGLDSDRSWVICSEINEFVWPGA